MKRQRRHDKHGRCTFIALFTLLIVLTHSNTVVSAWIPFSPSPSSSSLSKRCDATRRSYLLTRLSSTGENDSPDATTTTETQQIQLPQQRQHHVTIEYCTGCRWMMRSAWMAQELLTTFQDELHGVTLIPSRPPNPGGVFHVQALAGSSSDGTTAAAAPATLLWDRKEQGGFPELKQLKQILRDAIAPEQFLGHSDTADRKQPSMQLTTTTATNTAETNAATNCVDCQPPNDSATMSTSPTSKEGLASAGPASSASYPPSTETPLPNVSITYCTGCRWLLRAAWMGQELLTTFDSQINSLTLIPSKPPQKGGTFTVTLNGEMLWDRSEQGRFPEAKELKQLVRDRVAPEKDLGHSDDKDQPQPDPQPDLATTDEEEAARLRNFFGVQ